MNALRFPPPRASYATSELDMHALSGLLLASSLLLHTLGMPLTEDDIPVDENLISLQRGVTETFDPCNGSKSEWVVIQYSDGSIQTAQPYINPQCANPSTNVSSTLQLRFGSDTVSGQAELIFQCTTTRQRYLIVDRPSISETSTSITALCMNDPAVIPNTLNATSGSPTGPSSPIMPFYRSRPLPFSISGTGLSSATLSTAGPLVTLLAPSATFPPLSLSYGPTSPGQISASRLPPLGLSDESTPLGQMSASKMPSPVTLTSTISSMSSLGAPALSQISDYPELSSLSKDPLVPSTNEWAPKVTQCTFEAIKSTSQVAVSTSLNAIVTTGAFTCACPSYS